MLPKNDFTRKMKDFDTFQKLPKNVWYLGKLIVVKVPQSAKITKSGHTNHNHNKRLSALTLYIII